MTWTSINKENTHFKKAFNILKRLIHPLFQTCDLRPEVTVQQRSDDQQEHVMASALHGYKKHHRHSLALFSSLNAVILPRAMRRWQRATRQYGKNNISGGTQSYHEYLKGQCLVCCDSVNHQLLRVNEEQMYKKWENDCLHQWCRSIYATSEKNKCILSWTCTVHHV